MTNVKTEIASAEFFMTYYPLIALHGFLGEPADFLPLGLEGLFAPKIFHTELCPLKEWAQRFNRGLRDEHILLGYSMGARLAMHCIIDAPKKYRAAILLAGHPGLMRSYERGQRYAADIAWAARFLKEPWEQVLRAWHQQPALKSSKIIHRPEDTFSRQELSRALRYFSLGTQNYLIPALKTLELPILWLSPAQEMDKIKNLSLKHPGSQVIPIEQGGHRFMMTYPRKTSSIIHDFMQLNGISRRPGCFFGA